MSANEMPATEVPQTLENLDRTIAAFDTVEQLLQSLSPDTWRQDLDNIYTQSYIYYRSKSYHLASRQSKGNSYNTVFSKICENLTIERKNSEPGNMQRENSAMCHGKTKNKSPE